MGDITEIIKKTETDYKKEYEFSDPDVRLELKETESMNRLTEKCSNNFLNFVFLMPDGFKHRSMAIEGLTTSSLNAGVIKTTESEIVITWMIEKSGG